MICKYKHVNIDFDLSSNGLANSPEYREMCQKLDECSHLTDEIEQEFIAVNSSIEDFRDSVDSISGSLMNVSKSSFGVLDNLSNMKIKEKDYDAAGAVAVGAVGVGLATALGGVAVSLVGGAIAKRKERKAEEERQRLLAAALAKKQEIARVKYEPLRKAKGQLSESVGKKLIQRYVDDVVKTVNVSDDSSKMTIEFFSRIFGMTVKYKFLDETLDFFLEELSAWKAGNQQSHRVQPSQMNILLAMIAEWPSRLESSLDWDKYIKQQLGNQSDTLPLPIAMLFSKPALFGNFVGINFDVANNCPQALLSASGNKIGLPKGSAAAKLIGQNQYYKDCESILENDLNLNLRKDLTQKLNQFVEQNKPDIQKPKGFGVEDICIPALVVLFSALIPFVTFMVFPSLFIRDLSTLLAFAATAYGLYAIQSNNWNELFSEKTEYCNLPFAMKYEDYNAVYKEYLSKCQDYRTECNNTYNAMVDTVSAKLRKALVKYKHI